MKTLQAKGPNVWLGSSNSNDGYIEYIAAFPNAKVNADDWYKACIMILNNLKLICDEGVNFMQYLNLLTSHSISLVSDYHLRFVLQLYRFDSAMSYT